MKKPRGRLAPAAFPDRLVAGGNDPEVSRDPVGNQAESQPPNRASRRRPAPLPRDYAGLYALLRARPYLRTELVDAGLAVYRAAANDTKPGGG